MDGYVLQDGVCVGQCSPGHYRDSGFCKRKYLSMNSAAPVANFRLAFLLDLVSFPRDIFVVSDESLLLHPHPSRHMLKSDVSVQPWSYMPIQTYACQLLILISLNI